MPSALNVAGQRHNSLTAIEPAGYNQMGSQRKTAWMFGCDCGKVVRKTLMNVRSGDTKSCGCQAKVNHERAGERMRLASGESSFRALMQTYKRRAARTDIPFTLTADTFRALTKAPCDYCGTKPYQAKLANRESFGTYLYNGIDRTDYKQGYIDGNVVPCCGPCNRAKHTLDRENFLELVRLIARHSLGL